jgi:alpha-tubulin suppressor-like RCC1 family protein
LRPSISNTPVQRGEDTDWKDVAADGYSSVALKEDGTFWTVGFMFFSAQIGTDADWAAVATGNDQVVGIKNNGTLWAGEFLPVQVGSDNNWVAIAAGGNHTAALKKDGTLWAWGTNTYGQLGDGTLEDRHAPVQIGF